MVPRACPPMDCWTHLVLQEHDELGAQDQALEPGWLQKRKRVRGLETAVGNSDQILHWSMVVV